MSAAVKLREDVSAAELRAMARELVFTRSDCRSPPGESLQVRFVTDPAIEQNSWFIDLGLPVAIPPFHHPALHGGYLLA